MATAVCAETLKIFERYTQRIPERRSDKLYEGGFIKKTTTDGIEKKKCTYVFLPELYTHT
jgi:hypothetical protein